jgi:lysophospholipase L1-like esterase
VKRVIWLAIFLLLSGAALWRCKSLLHRKLRNFDNKVQARVAPVVCGPTLEEVKRDQALLTEYAQLDRYHNDNQRILGETKQRVLFYGDSITDFWAWPANAGLFFPGKHYLNRGIWGQTTSQMVLRFRQDVINLNPMTVVILAGTNDLSTIEEPRALERIEDNLETMVELAAAHNIRVILCSILPVNTYPWNPTLRPEAKIRELNDWLRYYAAVHSLTYVDYYSAMVNREGGLRSGLSDDGIHPNPAGYALMAPLAQAAIDNGKSK